MNKNITLATLILAASLITGCEDDTDNPNKVYSDNTSIQGNKEAAQFIVECAAAANPMSDEEGKDQKLIGIFLGWVNKDINKEEGDVLESNNLTMKDVGSHVNNRARVWYIEQLNKV